MPRFYGKIFQFFAIVAATLQVGWAQVKPFYSKTSLAKNTGFALVELFTSEGCSSCPPADDAVAKLLKDHKMNVYVLGFHVDYWNNLGWRDMYSNADYSERQQHYANIFNLNSVYTPQVVVNGAAEFTGSNRGRLNEVVEKSLAQPVANAINVSAKWLAGSQVSVTCLPDVPITSGIVSFALVQLQAQSNVKRGENSGRLLSHVNVVRYFKTVSAKDALALQIISIPDGLAIKDCKLVVFAQDAQWKVTAVAETAIY